MKKPVKRALGAAIGLGLALIFASAAKEGYVDSKIKSADPVGRALTAGEIQMARPIFGDDADYSLVRLHTAPDEGEDAKSFGNDIYLESGALHRADLSAPDVSVDDKKMLIHELDPCLALPDLHTPRAVARHDAADTDPAHHQQPVRHPCRL